MPPTPPAATPPLRSRNWFAPKNLDGFMHRSYLKAEGFSDAVFDGRPVVGICNSWSELNNCNAHLRQVAEGGGGDRGGDKGGGGGPPPALGGPLQGQGDGLPHGGEGGAAGLGAARKCRHTRRRLAAAGPGRGERPARGGDGAGPRAQAV